MLFTNKLTNNQTNRRTNANDYITSTEGGGNNCCHSNAFNVDLWARVPVCRGFIFLKSKLEHYQALSWQNKIEGNKSRL